MIWVNLTGKIAALDPQKAELVKLRFFVGMTIDETSEALGFKPGDDVFRIHPRPPVRRAGGRRRERPSPSMPILPADLVEMTAEMPRLVAAGRRIEDDAGWHRRMIFIARH
jgi:hypothetical protein